MELEKTRSITSFISSANRQQQENIYNFSIDYPDGILSCNSNEYMEINVLSFDMSNTMYNISTNNNTFEMITNGITIMFQIAISISKQMLPNTVVSVLIENFIRKSFGSSHPKFSNIENRIINPNTSTHIIKIKCSILIYYCDSNFLVTVICCHII